MEINFGAFSASPVVVHIQKFGILQQDAPLEPLEAGFHLSQRADIRRAHVVVAIIATLVLPAKAPYSSPREQNPGLKLQTGLNTQLSGKSQYLRYQCRHKKIITQPRCRLARLNNRNRPFDSPGLAQVGYVATHKMCREKSRQLNGSEKATMRTKPYEIRWHGRGGQGAITAAKVVAQAAYLKGYRGVTAAPSFGAERRGAPVSASTRIARQPVMVISQVEKPDMVVVLDHTLLKYPAVSSGLDRAGWLVVNSWQRPQELNINGDFNIATADATGVCRELGLVVAGLPVVNTAILGALVHATELVDMASIATAIRERFSRNNTEINLSAIRKTFAITILKEMG